MDLWIKGVTAAITVCDQQGTILDLNDRSVSNFSKDGGSELCGRSLFACHPPAANELLREMLISPEPNTYITEKNGKYRLVHQAPWYEDGKFGGYVEFIFDVPGEIPIKKR